MNSHIYILTDGTNTKIGITTDFEKRMQTYRTHNPNIRVVKQYPCDTAESKKVESVIKHIFKDNLSHTSKEWFAVNPDEVDRYVSTLLEKPTKTDVLPSHHGVRLTNDAVKIFDAITDLVTSKKEAKEGVIKAKKTELAELFANKFALGIPEDRLPENVIHKDNMGVDLNNCNKKNSHRVCKSIRENITALPHDDHVWRFYHLIKLSTGFYIAICTARVSMPYLERIAPEEAKKEMIDAANEYGFYCTFHNDWSWHYPERTGLALYQPKTPISTILRVWENSFRKWVIERKELLTNESFLDNGSLTKTIEDITWDNTFPLEINSYDELKEIYLIPYVGISDDEDLPFAFRESYMYLIDKWKQQLA